MKHRWTWVVIALLLAGCTAGAAETAGSASTAPPPGGSEAAVSTESPQSDDTTASGEPVPLESVGADDREDDGFLRQPVTLPPGTYRASMYHVPVTFTTTDELTLFGRAMILSRDQRLAVSLVVGQPDQVADLSPAISQEELADSGGPGIPQDRLMELPEDVGAWLDDAEAVAIVDEGSTTVGGQQAPWWQVELQHRDDIDLACSPQPNVPPCQPLWNPGPQVGDGASLGDDFRSWPHRIWAVPAGDRTVLVAVTAPPDTTASAWFDTAEDIVASFAFD